jgi:hypothetical protein
MQTNAILVYSRPKLGRQAGGGLTRFYFEMEL